MVVVLDRNERCVRNYSPDTGRFLSEDPIGFEGKDSNLYRYVWNNPIKYKDPSGKLLITGTTVVAGAALSGGVIGAITGFATSNSCSFLGKVGDGVIGGAIGVAGGVIASVGSIGAIVSGTSLGFTGTLGVVIGGVAAGAGPSALNSFGSSAGGTSGNLGSNGGSSGNSGDSGNSGSSGACGGTGPGPGPSGGCSGASGI